MSSCVCEGVDGGADFGHQTKTASPRRRSFLRSTSAYSLSASYSSLSLYSPKLLSSTKAHSLLPRPQPRRKRLPSSRPSRARPTAPTERLPRTPTGLSRSLVTCSALLSRPPTDLPTQKVGFLRPCSCGLADGGFLAGLSILTLFSRVRTLFPYLWPSKSIGLQFLAVVCILLMLVKRFVNVLVPIFFGRIIGDLAAARRESLLETAFESLYSFPFVRQHPTTISRSTSSYHSSVCRLSFPLRGPSLIPTILQRTPTPCSTDTFGSRSSSTLSGR